MRDGQWLCFAYDPLAYVWAHASLGELGRFLSGGSFSSVRAGPGPAARAAGRPPSGTGSQDGCRFVFFVARHFSQLPPTPPKKQKELRGFPSSARAVCWLQPSRCPLQVTSGAEHNRPPGSDWTAVSGGESTVHQDHNREGGEASSALFCLRVRRTSTIPTAVPTGTTWTRSGLTSTESLI